MEFLPSAFQLSSNPVVSAIIPGTNITVDKSIGDVTVSSGGGGGSQTQVVTQYTANAPFTTGSYTTISTLAVNVSSPTVITLNYGFNTNSDTPTTVSTRILVNNVVSITNYYRLELMDADSTAAFSAYIFAPSAGLYTITFEGINIKWGNPSFNNIFSYALFNLSG